MATDVIAVSNFRPDGDNALGRLIADAIADGKVTLVIGDLGDREPTNTWARATLLPVVAAATLVREGDIWTFTYEQRQIRVIDGKGVRYLATLLQNPGVEIHALDLAAAETGGCSRSHGSAAHAADPGLQVRDASYDDAGPLLDSEAKRAYQAQLGELRHELEQAEAFNDHERAARAREEIEFLVRELAGAVGLGGRDRKACSRTERARVNVTRSVRSLIKRVAVHDAALGRELGATIRTGTFCAYEPDPRTSLAWWVRRSG